MNSIDPYLKDLNKLSDAARDALESRDVQNKAIFENLFRQIGELQKRTSPNAVKEQCDRIIGFIRFNEDIRTPISDITQKIAESTLLLKKHVEAGEDKHPEIELNIAIYCDIDGPDHNNAFGDEFQKRLEGNTPLILTKRFLKGTGVSCCSACRQARMIENEKTLLEKKENWDIYQSGEVLLFLPKSLLPEKTGLEKLEALNFASDGRLKPITIKMALQGSEGECAIGDLLGIFDNDSPKMIGKLFYIAGHGSELSPAGLDTWGYKLLLNGLEAQKCQGLTISSCYSGGQSSLLHIADEEDDQPIKISFPTIVRSIGDLITNDQEAEEDLDGYFENLKKFLEGTKPKTHFHFREMLEQLEEGKKVKDASNLVQVYFPSEAGGFRPVGEGKRGYSLTYTNAKREELSKVEIVVNNRDYLQVHPLVTLAPITCREKDPALVSMNPGTGHHYIKSLQLAEITPHAFMQKAFDFYQEGDDLDSWPDIHKGFFIGSLQTKNETMNEVALFMSKRDYQYIYRKDNQYYYYDGKMTKTITAFQYALIRVNYLLDTTPMENATRSSSAGQESDDLFYEAIESDDANVNKITEFLLDWYRVEISEETENFDRAIDVPDCYNIRKIRECTDFDKLLEIIRPLNSDETLDIVFMLIEAGEGELAEFIIQNVELDLNRYHCTGKSLIHRAVSLDMTDLTMTLISMDVNLNVLDYKGKSSLYMALENKNLSIVQMLLDQKDTNPNLQDKSGEYRILAAAIDQPDALELLLEKGADLELAGKEGKTTLGYFAEEGMLEEVETLLNLGADPNGGETSPLNLSIRANAPKIVQRLLEAGGKAFEPDQSGTLPIHEAIITGNDEIVKLLLNDANCYLDIQDENGHSPMELALLNGNKKIIQALKDKGAKLPPTLEKQAYAIMQHVIKRLVLLQEHDALRDLFTWNNTCVDLELIATKYLLDENPVMLSQLIAQGYIKPHTTREKSYSVFRLILLKALKDFEQYKNLILICLGRGADLNRKEGKKIQETALERVARGDNRELIEMLGAADESDIEQIIDLFDETN